MAGPNAFLIKEYELCFEHIRFYDSRNSDLLKYTFTLASSVAAAQFAVYQLVKGLTPAFFACQALLGTVVFLATLLLYFAMLQNRLYFVAFARQLNALRGHLMEAAAPEFGTNQLPVTLAVRAANPLSAHTFELLGVAANSSLFAAVATYGLCASAGNTSPMHVAVAIAVAVCVLETAGGMWYLVARDGKAISKADSDAHESRRATEPVEH